MVATVVVTLYHSRELYNAIVSMKYLDKKNPHRADWFPFGGVGEILRLDVAGDQAWAVTQAGR